MYSNNNEPRLYKWEVTFKDFYNNNYIYDYWKNLIYHASECFVNVRKLGDEAIKLPEIISRLSSRFSKEEIILNHNRFKTIEDSNKAINSLKTKISRNPEDYLPVLTHEIFEKRISNIRQLMLEVTQSCNQRCSYCIYSGNYHDQRGHADNKKIMSFNVARKSIDYFFSLLKSEKRTSRYDSSVIGFYGGEPLIGFELIKKCVQYIQTINNIDKIHFTITTNGTLLDKEMIDFFKKHDFSILLSLDGPKEEHDKFRVFKNNKGTFNRIWKSIQLLKKDKEYFINRVNFAATISKSHDLLKIENFYKNNFDKNSINVSMIRDEENIFFNSYESQIIFNDHLAKLYEKFSDSIVDDIPVSSFFDGLFGKNFIRILERDIINLDKRINSDLKIFNISSNCFPGEKIFVDTYGKFFVCERVNQFFSTGDYIHGLIFEKVKKIIDLYSKFVLDNCILCEARRLCSLCISHNGIGDNVAYNNYCDNTRKYLPEILSKFVHLYLKNKPAMIKNLYKRAQK